MTRQLAWGMQQLAGVAAAVSLPSERFWPPLVVSPGKSRSARGAMWWVKAASTWLG